MHDPYLLYPSKAVAPKDKSAAAMNGKQGEDHRPRRLFLCALAVATILITTTFLMLLIRSGLKSEVTGELSRDLGRSVITFQNLQAERLAALERENALLAELPTLKALMASGDDLTIQDGANEFWQLSGKDLFALVDPGGRIVALYSKRLRADTVLRNALNALILSPEKQYLIDGQVLYACSSRPLYLGASDHGTLLGYVISGVSVDRMMRRVSQPDGVEVIFLGSGHIVASTLSATNQAAFSGVRRGSDKRVQPSSSITLRGIRFLFATDDLSTSATSPLALMVLKSSQPAERWIARLDRIAISMALLTLFSITALVLALNFWEPYSRKGDPGSEPGHDYSGGVPPKSEADVVLS